ncbi:MAG: ATPase, partial [Methylomonas sp.]
GEGFVLVTGVPGTGKTMLVRNLVKNLNRDKLLIGLMMTSQVGPEDALRLMASTFGFQYLHNDKANLLSCFEQFVIEKAREGRRLLLIVDEAQNLPRQTLEELRMLTNIDVNGTSVFQVFLVGQPELKRTVYSPDMEQLKQRLVSTFHLDALDIEEMKEYILFRLQAAGWNGTPEFETNVFTAIHAFTEGIPRKINSLCDRLLLFGFLEELRMLDTDAVNKVIAEVKDEFALESTDSSTVPAYIPQTSIAIEPQSGSFDERLARLESAVSNLQGTLNKERALLRKAILIQLDMDDIYDGKAK